VSKKRPLYVAVIGSGAPTDGGREESLAEEVGRLLAQRGAVVVCGGASGVMEAVCRGAKGAGGTTIGILGGTDPGEANGYVDIPIVTGVGESRNSIVARTGNVVIAIGGEYGTLTEIAYALKFGKRVIGLHTWQLKRPDGTQERFELAATPAEAVERALDQH
jgi:uncharacterized protein (TIGR00725 family)